MVKRVPIIDPGHAANSTEDYGNFDDTSIVDIGKVWDLVSPLLNVTYAWSHVKGDMRNCDGHKTMLAFYDHFVVPNNVNHLQKQADIKLQNLMYARERNNWYFERVVNEQKEQHTILEGLTNIGYNNLDKRTKLSRLVNGVKMGSLNIFKAMILVNSDFCKDLENCVILYKDFLK